MPNTRGTRWLLRLGWLVPLGAFVAGIGVLILTYAFASIPLPQDVEYLSASAEVYDRHGKLIGTYTGEVRRFLLPPDELEALPDYIGESVIAAEDRDFYEHNGVSLRGIMRAAWANFTGGRIQQGGSTITQQYIKQAVLQDSSRTFARKAKEVVLAIKLERRFDKDDILGFYLNTIYLGRGAYGFEAAARTYFGYQDPDGSGPESAASQLSLAEASFLAAIIPAPESYQPDENRAGATERRDRVLDAMVEEDYIDRSKADFASRKPVRLAKGFVERSTNVRAAYFMEWLRKEYLYPEYGNELYTGGLKIHTTLDLGMQESAEDAVDSILTEPEDPQAALVSMTPTGAVRAMVGGEHYDSIKKSRQFNYATDYPGRSTGSSFKPFTLLAAIEDGVNPERSYFSGQSPAFIDECAGANGVPPWEVENYGGSSFGSMNLVQATTNSVNTIYAQLIAEIGPERVADLLKDFGFDRGGTREISDTACSLSLGILDSTVLEMARSYATFAARGALPEVMPIQYIENSENECVKAYRPEFEESCASYDELEIDQVVARNSADVLTQSLESVVTSGTAAANAQLGRPAAGKTGTAQENVDAWFGGYIPQLATVVWMGYPADKRKGGEVVVPQMRSCTDLELCKPVHGLFSGVTGGSLPTQIWAAYMREAIVDIPIADFAEPTEMPERNINQPPPVAPVPSATKEKEPEEEPSEEPVPSPSPEPQPSVQPSNNPSPIPTIENPDEDEDEDDDP